MGFIVKKIYFFQYLLINKQITISVNLFDYNAISNR
ncbi:hypothetical protein DSM03_102211 [Leeuwenhoekiella aestuarii]|uniref:Uncharacterized protein n=1 Tax=Leeuwenhoekiella aestuarii TaxID=2249426 RepID=A0A4Q0NVI9_9FLAO|nr:hypothetical protein DSM04_103447 [Leeuwenhoekiella aestuarii]RXG17335.1 hypothetical protein DSM03_102211 [Leeuwenhoekiella aestuarii]